MSFMDKIAKSIFTKIEPDEKDKKEITRVAKVTGFGHHIFCKEKWEGGRVEITLPKEHRIDTGDEILLQLYPDPGYIFATLTIKSMMQNRVPNIRHFEPDWYYEDRIYDCRIDRHASEDYVLGTLIMPNEDIIFSEIRFVPIDSDLGRTCSNL